MLNVSVGCVAHQAPGDGDIGPHRTLNLVSQTPRRAGGRTEVFLTVTPPTTT